MCFSHMWKLERREGERVGGFHESRRETSKVEDGDGGEREERERGGSGQ